MRRILSSFLLAAACLLTGGCTKEMPLFCDLTLRLVQPEGFEAVTVQVDNALQGNMLRNYNTGQDYDYPLFVNGKASLRVLKGVYLISFDGKATLSDGSVRTVRFSGYNAPDKAVSLLEDRMTLELEIRVL